MENRAGKRHFQRLPADRVAAAVIEIVVNYRLAAGSGSGFNPTILIAQPQDFADREHFSLRVLLDNASFLDRLDKGLGRSVAAGHFGPIDPDLAVIDLHAGQGGHDVLDHFDRRVAGAKHGPTRHLDPVSHVGRDSGTARKVAAHEDDPLIGFGRAELDANIASAPVAEAFDHRGGP